MKLKVREIVIFGLLGGIMYASKRIMEVLPNIHLLGVFVVAITLVYRKKALYPIYIYVLIEGLLNAFSTWWIPYTYIWTPLWALVMLLPKNIPERIKPIVYSTVCALHGFAFGTLYAPVQAALFGLDFQGMIAWIIAGLPFDFIHGISNFFCGFLIIPLVSVMKRSNTQ